MTETVHALQQRWCSAWGKCFTVKFLDRAKDADWERQMRKIDEAWEAYWQAFTKQIDAMRASENLPKVNWDD